MFSSLLDDDIMIANVPVCSIFSMISVIGQPKRDASLTSKFPNFQKTLEPALCHTYWYFIMSINITNFFSSLNRILSFVMKFQSVSNFFFIFTHFQDAITFDWINKYHNFFFNYSMICHLSNARKYCQIWLILLKLCDPKTI